MQCCGKAESAFIVAAPHQGDGSCFRDGCDLSAPEDASAFHQLDIENAIGRLRGQQFGGVFWMVKGLISGKSGPDFFRKLL